uniref:Uncharacterized protein n=1 Tax=Xiphophorus couchianus TaxID=32473 RepID=A0A3B5M7G8_9TELE
MATAGAAGTSGRTYSFKVVLLGEGCVGKTSLVLRYCENKFNDKHITTLQVRRSGRNRTEPEQFINPVKFIIKRRLERKAWGDSGEENSTLTGGNLKECWINTQK